MTGRGGCWNVGEHGLTANRDRSLADIESPWKTEDRTPSINVTRIVNGVDDKNNRYTDGLRRRIYDLPDFDGNARFRFV
jgi:hypothetical protein